MIRNIAARGSGGTSRGRGGGAGGSTYGSAGSGSATGPTESDGLPSSQSRSQTMKRLSMA
jgi:hypothetical protein